MLGMAAVSPHLARLWGDGNERQAVRVARTVMDHQVLVTALLALGMVCFGGPVLNLFFTAKYRAAAPVLPILSLGLMSFALSAQSQLLLLSSNGRFNRNMGVAAAVGLFALAWFLIPSLGVIGAATARTGVMVALSLGTMAAVVRRWGHDAVPISNILLGAIVASVAALLREYVWPTSIEAGVGIFTIGALWMGVTLRDETGRSLVAATIVRVARHV